MGASRLLLREQARVVLNRFVIQFGVLRLGWLDRPAADLVEVGLQAVCAVWGLESLEVWFAVRVQRLFDDGEYVRSVRAVCGGLAEVPGAEFQFVGVDAPAVIAGRLQGFCVGECCAGQRLPVDVAAGVKLSRSI